jgi:hypothetical protein
MHTSYVGGTKKQSSRQDWCVIHFQPETCFEKRLAWLLIKLVKNSRFC